MNAQPEPDFYVTRDAGATTLYLRKTPEDHFIWTPAKKRALPFASRALADAAASEINQHSSTPAVVVQE
jgi:hypothetical protein